MKLYMIDGYDTLFIAIMEWLNATNIDYPEYIVYASQMSIELMYSSECIDEEPSEECFSVLLRYNGNPLKFEGVCSDPALCTYTEFTNYLNTIWYSGENADDLYKACDASSLGPFDTYHSIITSESF